jgi:hopanoid C-3 methylase
MPTPRRDLWDPRRYYSVWSSEDATMFQRLFASASMVRTSFGCRMRCTFCIVPKLFNGKHHTRPAEIVAEEIAGLPTDHVYFCDDENFIDAGFAHELAEALERRGVRKRYFAWTRATTVNKHPDLFARWRKLGLDCAFLGFEFPSDEELRATRKGSTVAENARAHTSLRSMKIAVHAAFCRNYGRQIREASLKNPRRADRRPIHPFEFGRLARAQIGWDRVFDGMYRDYPRELWDA